MRTVQASNNSVWGRHYKDSCVFWFLFSEISLESFPIFKKNYEPVCQHTGQINTQWTIFISIFFLLLYCPPNIRELWAHTPSECVK